MILLVLILAAIGLAAFMAVVIGVQVTERRKSFDDPPSEGSGDRSEARSGETIFNRHNQAKSA